jgi:hypothetical protein
MSEGNGNGQKSQLPYVLQQVGETHVLPDGRSQMIFRCETVADYVAMPHSITVGALRFYKAGRDADVGVAYYHTGDVAGDLI